MKTKGFSIVELTIALTIMSFTTFATFALFLTGLRTCEAAETDVNLSQPSSQALRRISEALRQATNVTIADSGMTVHYTMPKMTTGANPTTAEKEVVYPVVNETVTRTFAVTGGQLVDRTMGRTLVENVITYDPLPSSSQYNKTYAPFQLTTIGSRRAISINIITSTVINGKRRYARLKTTVMVQNIR